MHLYLPPLLLLLTCARHSQARHEATKVTCSEQQEVTLQCPLPPGSEPAATHSQPVVWFIGSGLNGSCAHPDYVESFMKGGHHRQALFDIKHHHFIPDNHRTSLGRSDDGSSLTLSVRNLRASDSGHYCCAKRVHHHGHPEVPHAGTKETHNGTKKPRVRDANAGSSPRQDGAHPYNVLSVTELLVTQAQGGGVKTSPACHDGKADTRDVVIVILISLVIISVIVIVITCFRAQKRRGRVIEREMSNIQSPTSAQVMSPDSEVPVFDFEYQPGLQGGVFPRPSPLQSSLDEEVFTDEHGPDNGASTLQLYSV
ncbi:uncharacterized protein LOC144732106 [Lampetra planeri]